MLSKSKGAYIAVEQMILFAIGIAVLIGIAGVFTSIQAGTKQLSVEDQFREVAELTLAHVVYVYNTGYSQDADAEDFFQIPAELADHTFEIRLRNNAVTVISLEDPNANYTLTTLGLNLSSVTLSGEARSSRPKVKVNYSNADNTIVIRSVSV